MDVEARPGQPLVALESSRAGLGDEAYAPISCFGVLQQGRAVLLTRPVSRGYRDTLSFRSSSGAYCNFMACRSREQWITQDRRAQKVVQPGLIQSPLDDKTRPAGKADHDDCS